MKNKYTINNEYSVRSGVLAAVSDKIDMGINGYGEYEYVVDEGDLTHEERSAVFAVDSTSDNSVDEDVLGGELFSQQDGIRHTRALGYYKDLFIGHAGDPIRKNSSSGGMATWIALKLLEMGEIDGVIHAKNTNDGDGILYKYGISRTPEDIKHGAKSRYYPLELSSVLREVKEKPGRYLLIGIPSFITEVRLLQQQNPIFKESIAFTIALVCGHQKTMKYAENIGWQAGMKPGDLKEINFRKKVAGTPANVYTNEVTGLINGKETTKIISSTELTGVDWAMGFFKTKFSDYVDDAFGETADVTLGDAWLPEYQNDSRGTSIVIARNSKLSDVITKGMKDGALQLIAADDKKIASSQKGCVHHYIDEMPYRLWRQDKAGIWRPKIRTEASKSKVPFLKRRVQDMRAIFRDKSKQRYRKAVEMNNWDYFGNSFGFDVFRYTLAYFLISIQKNGVIGTMRKLMKKYSKKKDA